MPTTAGRSVEGVVVQYLRGGATCPEETHAPSLQTVRIDLDISVPLGFTADSPYHLRVGDATTMINGLNDLALFAPLCNPRRRRGILHRIYLRGAT